MNKYEPVIGLEVHVELNTKSKMFCDSDANYFGKPPNSCTCPTCLGLPGSLPYINEAAIEDCIKIGLALNCQISTNSLFERKNYFYPDLPKGYQISQYRWPQCVHGWLLIVDSEGNEKKIRINRVHQEEDTAKLVHQFGNQKSKIKNQNYSGIDFNRSSVPLVEIVTEPDFSDSSQVKDYAKKLQQLFRYLGVSNADMERGDMRLEANISVRKIKDQKSKIKNKELPHYRVELKNINSFRFMVAAIEYEIKRQIEALENGEKLAQETRGWNEDKKITYVQRSKEEAHDYRYFPDPDLPPLEIEESRVKSLGSSLPELPWEKTARFVADYGISQSNARILTESKDLADFFEKAVDFGKGQGIDSKQIANFIINQKVDFKTTPENKVIEEISSQKIGVIGDMGELEKLAKEVIEENPTFVEAYKKGKLTAIQALVGAAMRKSQGKAHALKVKEILEKILLD